MERCVWLNSPNDPVPEGTHRVYLGDDGCPRFLANAAFTREVEALQSRGYAVTVVTPPLTPASLNRFRALLAGLCHPTEVVVNDVGGFVLACESRCLPVLGRWLTRQCTDPAVAGFRQSQPPRVVWCDEKPVLLRHSPPPDPLWAHWRTPPGLSSGALAVYRSLLAAHSKGNLLRAEVDLPPHGLGELTEGITVTAHTGEVPVALEGCGNCAGCPPKPVAVGATRSGVMIYKRRNTLFYRLPPGPIPACADRLVRRL